jgi:hypothetical protein
VKFHRPFWLTTRDAHGPTRWNLAGLSGGIRCPDASHGSLRAVRPTNWRGSKVSGIDLASDFIWIDDDPLAVEIDALRGLGLLHRLLIVDSDDDLLSGRHRDYQRADRRLGLIGWSVIRRLPTEQSLA